MKRKYYIGIIGCGAILARHIEAIQANPKHFELAAVCDIDKDRVGQAAKKNTVPGFTDYKEMLKALKGKLNLITIATPNSLHYDMAINSLEQGYDVLIEKPIDFDNKRIFQIAVRAQELGKQAYAVLQVRYNPTVKILQEALQKNYLGDIRIVDFIQRWQRPYSYFEGWRGQNGIGGGTLYECGIHYLDIIQLLFGVPTIKSTSVFTHKHKHVDIEDTILSIVEYPYGASGFIEVTIASEPSNLECSLSILGSKGFVKIGGHALDKVEQALFEEEKIQKKWDKLEKKYGKAIQPNSYGTHIGSCPNHPTLYAELAAGHGFTVDEALNSIKFIQDIYQKDGVKY
ncbi:MAG: Gfo/Idh/MocA family oxidoreductase [Patescibacteria group bacterium]|nr:Gfo/Idh/MocA family oxidoreductase [Patescibacteria group bacterium]